MVATDVTDERGEAAIAALRADGADVSYFHADVRSTDQVTEAVAYAERTHGQLDVVVGQRRDHGPRELPADRGDRRRGLGARDRRQPDGGLQDLRAAVPALRRAGGGAMSATSSVSGVYATVYRSAYGASKGGLNALVRGLAVELAPDEIRVNAMCPGTMQTNIRQSLERTREEIQVPAPIAS